LENVDDPNIWTSSRSGFSLNFCKKEKKKAIYGVRVWIFTKWPRRVFYEVSRFFLRKGKYCNKRKNLMQGSARTNIFKEVC
jgi:hypothetical protein